MSTHGFVPTNQNQEPKPDRLTRNDLDPSPPPDKGSKPWTGPGELADNPFGNL